VIFNGGLSKLAFSFTDLKPSRHVAGFPVYRTATREGPIDDIVITQDGRLPVIPVTLGDQLDSLTEFARKSLRGGAQTARREGASLGRGGATLE
jgi:hypothetical protein